MSLYARPVARAGFIFFVIFAFTMKQIFLLLSGMLLACPLFSQEYQPRDTWPFIYESFLPGATRTVDGALATEASFNIAVYDGTLMYIGADQTLMRADMSRVFSPR